VYRYKKKKRRRTRRKQSTRESELRKKHRSAPASTTEERQRERLPSDFFLTPPVFFFHETDRISPCPSPRSYRPTPPPSITSPFNSPGRERETLYITTCFFAKNFRFVSLFPYLNGKISHNTVFSKTAKEECVSSRRNNHLYFLAKDSEVIMQLQSHCLEKHQTSFFSVFFLSRFYLSIKISSIKKNLKQEIFVRCTNKIFYHQLHIPL
jgi:hypothetical protein